MDGVQVSVYRCGIVVSVGEGGGAVEICPHKRGHGIDCEAQSPIQHLPGGQNPDSFLLWCLYGR